MYYFSALISPYTEQTDRQTQGQTGISTSIYTGTRIYIRCSSIFPLILPFRHVISLHNSNNCVYVRVNVYGHKNFVSYCDSDVFIMHACMHANLVTNTQKYIYLCMYLCIFGAYMCSLLLSYHFVQKIFI